MSCPGVPVNLDLDLDTASTHGQDDVKLRRDSDTLRQIRERKKERTPTAIVSNAFTFLNDHQISIVDAVEDGSIKDIEFVEGDGDDLTDRCLPRTDCHMSKDSGFASLERHLHSDDIHSFKADDSHYMLDSNSASHTHLSTNHLQSSPDVNSKLDLDSEVNVDTPCQHSVGENTASNKEEIQAVPVSETKLDSGNGQTVGTNRIDVYRELSLYVENVECEIKEIEIASQSGDDVGKIFDSKNDSRLGISEKGSISVFENGTQHRKDNMDKGHCDASEETVCHYTSVPNVDSNGKFSMAVTEASKYDIEGEDGIASVDMRRRVDVIPASPIKSPSCDTKSKASKTGLLLKANPSTEIASDDSSDEDTGIYAESFRRSNWIRVSQEKKRTVKQVPCPMSRGCLNEVPPQPTLSKCVDDHVTDDGDTPVAQDEVFTESLRSTVGQTLCHKRSDSVTTTHSEHEFKTSYISRRKCLVQRADSQQEYHRLSARIYDQDKEVILERTSDSEDLGLHLLDSHPTYITSVDADSPADKAGILEGQILVTVNDFNVLLTDHNDIIKLIQDCKGPLRLGVASTDSQPIRDLQAPVISGHMYKLGTSNIVRLWKKRFFILRNDNCLYYYKTDQDMDPLGALPLAGYTISRHTDTSKDFCFKADKYRARTYYFMTENRDQLTQWVTVLTEAALRSKKQKESSSFMSVSSHNVSLPALDIRRPECSGNLHKLSPNTRSWRRRYCLLKDACIYYYKDVNSFSALGVAHLHGYTVDAAGHSKKKNSFSLQPPDVKMRQFHFGADNETEKKRWVEAIIYSIQRWVPADTSCETNSQP